jgi:hypothetical protein
MQFACTSARETNIRSGGSVARSASGPWEFEVATAAHFLHALIHDCKVAFVLGQPAFVAEHYILNTHDKKVQAEINHQSDLSEDHKHTAINTN